MMPAPPLADALRQMLAVLEQERQALAALDIGALSLATQNKTALCEVLQGERAADEECRGLAEAARQANEVNRRMRNLMAANVTARLDTLTGETGRLYSRHAGGLRRRSTDA